MAFSAFSDSYAFELVPDATTGKPTVDAATCTQSFSDGVLNEVKGLFNGGRTASVGASNTFGNVLKVWTTKTVDNVRQGDNRLRLNPFSQG